MFYVISGVGVFYWLIIPFISEMHGFYDEFSLDSRCILLHLYWSVSERVVVA